MAWRIWIMRNISISAKYDMWTRDCNIDLKTLGWTRNFKTLSWKPICKLLAEKCSANYHLKNRLTILDWEVDENYLRWEPIYTPIGWEVVESRWNYGTLMCRPLKYSRSIMWQNSRLRYIYVFVQDFKTNFDWEIRLTLG